MTLDIAALRASFPSLTSGIAHFDGPGGTQTPTVVGAAIADTLTGPLSNRGDSIASERNAEHAISAFRDAMADLLGADPRGVVYGRSATQITYDFSRALAKTWSEGDEIVVTQLDHDCNVRPWVQAAEARGVVVRWLRLDPTTAELDLADLAEVVGDRTRLVAVTAASNLLGTIPPVAAIAERAHRSARWSTSTASTTRHTHPSRSRRWVRTSSCARHTSSSVRTAPRWSPLRQCSSR